MAEQPQRPSEDTTQKSSQDIAEEETRASQPSAVGVSIFSPAG